MSRGVNQKLKVLYELKMLRELTDDEHGLTVWDIIDRLAAVGISADRKTIYLDIEELRKFGVDIVPVQRGRQIYYHLASREFELPELKLLVDSVQAAKFISERKSRILISKLASMTSKYDANKLQRQVVITGRVKSMNESIYYSVDTIHTAISENVRIRFQYYQWNARKKMELRRNGMWYDVSPWALVWDNEYYYLIGFDEIDQKIKHYRVDKMHKLEKSDLPREGEEIFAEIDLPKYSRGLFGMFGGENVTARLYCENRMAGAIIDRFGKGIEMTSADKEHFIAQVEVSSSEQFIGWIIGLGSGVKIIGPDSLVAKMKEEAVRIYNEYV